MTQATLDQNYSDLGGLDVASHDIRRKSRFASSLRNVEFLKNNSSTCRKGSKGRAKTKGGGGTKTYVYLDTDETRVEEVVTISDNLNRLLDGSITITYTGSGVSAVIRISAALVGTTYSFFCDLEVDGVSAYSQDLGTGIDETSPFTITALVAAIDALTDFGCTLSAGADGTTPAAFLPNIEQGVGASLVIPFEYWEEVYCPTNDPFATFWARLGDSDFENAALQNNGNRLFIATGFNKLYKYDSVSLYAAGMPEPAAISSATTGVGLTGSYSWFITYEQIDALGISIEGDASNETSLTLANQKGRITIPCIQTSSEYLTSCAIVNGNQGPVTSILVDAAHTLQVGQTLYGYTSAGVEFTRVITSRDNTHVGFASAVTVLDNAVLSANLRINLYRNANGGVQPYLVKSFANDSTVASFTYDDDLADATLITQLEYEEPVLGHGVWPSNIRYLASYQNTLVGSKGIAQSEVVHHSDLDDPEYYVEGITRFELRSGSNNPVTGVGATKELLIVLKENETHVLTGNLPEAKYRLDRLASNVGCSSYSSICEVGGILWFYSKDFGIQRVVNTNRPDELSHRILPLFTTRTTDTSLQIAHRRVVAVDVPNLQIALFFVPRETDQSGYYPNDNSFVVAADYRNQENSDTDYDDEGRLTEQHTKIRWSAWDGMNLAGGADIYDNELIWTERRYGDTITNVEFPLVGRLEDDFEDDFADHAQPIEWEYKWGWLDQGQPKLLKKYIGASIDSFPGEEGAGEFSVTVQTEIDFLNGQRHSEKVVAFGDGSSVSGGFGTWAFGIVAFGEPQIPNKGMKFKLTRAVAIKLIFLATVWKFRPVISGFTLEVVPAFKPKIPRR